MVSEQIQALRTLIEATDAELAELDARRERIAAMRETYISHLRFLAEQGAGVQGQLLLSPETEDRRKANFDRNAAYHWTRPHKSSAMKGRIGMVTAVLRVLAEAKGEPMHVRDILPQALALGAVTEARDPANVVDLVAYNLQRAGKPVEKVSAKRWRWTGDNANRSPDGDGGMTDDVAASSAGQAPGQSS